MDNQTNHISLTASELANLWTQYMNDSMACHFLTHSLKVCKDKEVYAILEYALSLSQSHLTKLKDFFQNENYPVPQGFSKSDVNLDAPRLFSDTFMLVYLQIMSLHGLSGYALSVGTSVRSDQRRYYIQCNNETMELHNRTVTVMLKKGIYSRTPVINAPDNVDFVKKQNFMFGWIGERRPLNAIEISGIHYNMQKTVVKVVLEIAFSQVAKSAEIRDYFIRGIAVCEKQNEVLGSILVEEHLSPPRFWASEVTNSSEAPFSDKLMLFQIVSLVSVALGYNGAAMSVSQRKDLSLQYIRLMAEMGQYAEDGANLLIKNGWLEQPPTIDDREAIAKKK